MPRRTTHVPQHRRDRQVPFRRHPSATPGGRGSGRLGARLVAGAAAVTTAMALSSAVQLGGASGEPGAATLTATTPQTPASPTDAPGSRVQDVSRSDARTSVDVVKKAALDQDPGGARTAVEDLTRRDPRTVARALLPRFGFGGDQYSCLDALYVSESGWDVHADNPTSSAYGIPQALPGEKMASAGADWADNAATQIEWGLGYIKARYGTPCAAWSFKQANNWY